VSFVFKWTTVNFCFRFALVGASRAPHSLAPTRPAPARAARRLLLLCEAARSALLGGVSRRLQPGQRRAQSGLARKGPLESAPSQPDGILRRKKFPSRPACSISRASSLGVFKLGGDRAEHKGSV